MCFFLVCSLGLDIKYVGTRQDAKDTQQVQAVIQHPTEEPAKQLGWSIHCKADAAGTCSDQWLEAGPSPDLGKHSTPGCDDPTTAVC